METTKNVRNRALSGLIRHVEPERGGMLLDTLIATAIFGIVVAAIFGPAFLGLSHVLPDATHTAVMDVLDNEMMRIEDALKYTGNRVVPITIATSAPIPIGSPVPLTLQLRTTVNGDGSQAIVLQATYQEHGTEYSIVRNEILPPQAPIPGTQLERAPVAPPTGAP